MLGFKTSLAADASGITDVFIRAITVPLLAKIVGKVDGIKSFAGEQLITKQDVTPTTRPLEKAELISEDRLKDLKQEADEIVRILTSIVKATKQNGWVLSVEF